jgi:hypothetical protein
MTTSSGPGHLTEIDLRTYEWLKKEIESAVEETRALERYSLVGTALVWAFLVKDVCQCPPIVFWWIPFVLSLLAGLRALALYLGIDPRASYLKQIEARGLQSGGLGGWEEYWQSAKRRRWVGKTALLFWVLLILGTGLIPFWIIAELECLP